MPPAPPSVISPGRRLHRVPDPIKSAPKGEAIAVRFARGPGLHGARRRLPENATLAEAVSLLIGQVVPMRTAPDGRLLCWWRIGTAAGPLSPDMVIGDLDDEETYCFHPVPNELWPVAVQLPGLEPRTMQLGAGIPMVSLIDALGLELSLEPGDWSAAVDGVPIGLYHVLADRPGAKVLQLARA
jgi:hypothetical protein